MFLFHNISTHRNRVCRILSSHTVVIKSYIFWEVMLYSQLKVSSHFRGTCYLHLQCQTVSHTRHQYEAGSKQMALCASCWFLAWLLLVSEDGGSIFVQNIGLLSANYMELYSRRQYSKFYWQNIEISFKTQWTRTRQILSWIKKIRLDPSTVCLWITRLILRPAHL